MIELERHIEILLLSNDCVIVPALGGFVAHHIDARYDGNDGLFLPPLRTLGFNPQLTMNDSLLAQSYAEANDISYPEAMKRMESDVQTLRQLLQQEGSYELNGIGLLSVNNEGHIEFAPCEAGILTPEFYGLSSFEMAPVSAKDETPATIMEPANSQKPKSKSARIISINTDEQTGQKMVSISMNALRNTAVAAILIAAFFLIASPISNNPKLLQTEKVKSGILYNIFSNSTQEKAEEPRPVELVAKQKAQPVAKPEPSHYWTLVLCSHVGQKNANAFTDMLHAQGFKDAAVLNGTNIKVIYGKYASEQAAHEAQRTLKDNKHFKEAWVMEVND